MQLIPVLIDFEDFESLEYDYLLQYTQKPFFMDRKINVHKTRLNLKPLFKSKECFVVNISDIFVHNLWEKAP